MEVAKASEELQWKPTKTGFAMVSGYVSYLFRGDVGICFLPFSGDLGVCFPLVFGVILGSHLFRGEFGACFRAFSG